VVGMASLGRRCRCLRAITHNWLAAPHFCCACTTPSCHYSPRGFEGTSYRLKLAFRKGEYADRMSALGQKQTFAAQNGMSALPTIATSIASFGMPALGQKRTLHHVLRRMHIAASDSVWHPDLA